MTSPRKATSSQRAIDNIKEEEDELESSEEEEDPKEDPLVFKIRNPLPTSKDTTRSAGDLHRRIHDATIDWDPPYQRDVVWSDAKQIALIDSLWRNFHIPPLVFAIHIDEDGLEVMVCVDGKQRLTSLQKFFDGQIPHYDKKTKKSWYYTLPPGAKKGSLAIPEGMKRAFADKQIRCVEYRDLPEGAEREIFQRVQLGVTLTSAEKSQAIDSSWTRMINNFLTKYVHQDDGFPAFIPWETRRAKDFQCLGIMIMVCYELPNHTHPAIAKLNPFLESAPQPDRTFVDHMEEVLSLFLRFASDPEYNGVLKTKNKLAPVEFIYCGVLIAKLHRPSLDVLARHIKGMREDVRRKHQDIRHNSSVTKTLFEYVDNVKVQSWPSNPWNNNDDALVFGSATSPTRKRKHAGDSEQDPDYRPSFRPTRSNARR